MQELEDFKEIEVEQMKEIIDDVAKETVKELKATSPCRPQGGKYKKGWKKKVTYENSVRKRTTICNSVYQLTHLLEKGHAKRNGGTVSAIPHIKPAEERAAANIERRLQKL